MATTSSEINKYHVDRILSIVEKIAQNNGTLDFIKVPLNGNNSFLYKFRQLSTINGAYVTSIFINKVRIKKSLEILQIDEQDLINKNEQEIKKLVDSQYKKMSLIIHPDKLTYGTNINSKVFITLKDTKEFIYSRPINKYNTSDINAAKQDFGNIEWHLYGLYNLILNPIIKWPIGILKYLISNIIFLALTVIAVPIIVTLLISNAIRTGATLSISQISPVLPAIFKHLAKEFAFTTVVAIISPLLVVTLMVYDAARFITLPISLTYSSIKKCSKKTTGEKPNTDLTNSDLSNKVNAQAIIQNKANNNPKQKKQTPSVKSIVSYYRDINQKLSEAEAKEVQETYLKPGSVFHID